MLNQKLRKARMQKHWSIERAADEVKVSWRTYLRWEHGTQNPHPYNLDLLSKAFEMVPEDLGFTPEISISPTEMSVTESVRADDKAIPTTYVLGANNVGTTPAIVRIGVSALTLAQQMYGYTIDELLLSIEQELRRLDAMAQQHPGKNRTRREALEFLIGLPMALMGLHAMEEGKASLLVEEVLPSYVTAVPACWRLYFDGGIAEVEQVLSGYLSQLSTLARQPSRYQKLAASSASQAYQLFWLLALQHQDFGTALTAIKQASYYGDIAEDNHLRLASLVRQAHVFFHLRRPIQQLQLHEKAVQYSSDVSPLLQGWLYVVLAESQAHLGQEEEAKRSLSMARDRFPDHPEDDPHFSYVPVDHFFFANHEVLTQLHLNQPKQAWERLAHIDKDVPTTLVPRRVELQNRQADTSLKLGDMEQACTYVELAGTSALKLGSDLRYSEACETYQQMQLKWPQERRIKALADLFQQY